MKQFKKCVNFDEKGQFVSEALLEGALGICGKGIEREIYNLLLYTRMDLKTFGSADFAKIDLVFDPFFNNVISTKGR